MKQSFLAIIALITFLNQVLAQQETMSESDFRRSTNYYNQALDHLSNYKDSLAIIFMSKAIELNNGNTDFYLGRAQTFSLLNRLADAEKDILKAIELSEKQYDLHYNAGNIYFKSSKIEEAILHYSLALEYNEDTPEEIMSLPNCLFNRGNSYMKIKRYEDAEKDFSESISLRPEFTNAIHNRGIARKNLNLKDDACMDFIKADSLGSNISSNYLISFCD